MSIQNIPIWILACTTILLVLLSVEIGYRTGMAIHTRTESEKESPVSVISGAILGLLSFMLAFTFGILYNRYEDRKVLVRNEANAITTIWHSSGFMPEPDRVKSGKLLQEYVDLRVNAAKSLDIVKVQKALDESVRIQGQIWELAVRNSSNKLNTILTALYMQSLNELIHIHNLRTDLGYQSRTPQGLWLSLYSLLLFSMVSIGYQTAIAGSRRTIVTLVLAISFTIVFVLIAGLDQPKSGFFKVPQQPLINLQVSMGGKNSGVTDTLK